MLVDDIRTDKCLYGFRCGVKELEKFAKAAFREHGKPTPDYRVRCLYEDNDRRKSALGYYSLSIKIPKNGEMPVSAGTIYAGDRAFLYIDHFAVKKDEQGKKLSSWLMVDLMDAASSVMNRFGRIDYLSLNAANKDALSFFSEKWKFSAVTTDSYPLLVLDRVKVIELIERIKDKASRLAE